MKSKLRVFIAKLKRLSSTGKNNKQNVAYPWLETKDNFHVLILPSNTEPKVGTNIMAGFLAQHKTKNNKRATKQLTGQGCRAAGDSRRQQAAADSGRTPGEHRLEMELRVWSPGSRAKGSIHKSTLEHMGMKHAACGIAGCLIILVWEILKWREIISTL